jgi:hypothetical protein
VDVRRPDLLLEAYCAELRASDAGGAQPLSLKLSRYCRALLREAPFDPILAVAVERLAARSFQLPPPPPEALPEEAPGETFRRWPEADRAAVAAAIVALPDPTAETARARAVLELFLRVPGELPRARILLADLERARALSKGEIALLAFRLEVATAAAAGERPAFGPLLGALRAAGGVEALREGLRRAAAFELRHLTGSATGDVPRGASWLVPFADDTAVANTTLALMRRPALGDALPRAIDWLTEAGPPAWLTGAEAADREGDFARGSALLETALASTATAAEARAVLAARRALLCDPALGDAGSRAVFPLPALAMPTAPRSGWEPLLGELLERPEPVPETDDEAAIAAALGDRRALAEWRLATRRLDAAGDVELLGRQRVRDALGLTPPVDEVLIAANPAPALVCHALMDAGLARSLLALRLLGAGIEPAGALAADAPDEAAPADAPDGSTDDTASAPDAEHHDPTLRTAAARALFDAGEPEAAAAVVVALLRKAALADRADGLHTLIADLLELDAPPDDLLPAVLRALSDERRNGPLLAELARRPHAAFGLHEALYDYARDPSRADSSRRLALTAWLGIWRASETAPDALDIGRIRETDPALLLVAAACLAGAPSVLRDAAARWAALDSQDDDALAESLIAATAPA